VLIFEKRLAEESEILKKKLESPWGLKLSRVNWKKIFVKSMRFIGNEKNTKLRILKIN
jgi:hypothetical protein